MAKGLLPICKTPKMATALASLGLGKGTGRDNIGSDESKRSQASESDLDWDDLDNLPELDVFSALQAATLDLDAVITGDLGAGIPEEFLAIKREPLCFEELELFDTSFDAFFAIPSLLADTWAGIGAGSLACIGIKENGFVRPAVISC